MKQVPHRQYHRMVSSSRATTIRRKNLPSFQRMEETRYVSSTSTGRWEAAFNFDGLQMAETLPSGTEAVFGTSLSAEEDQLNWAISKASGNLTGHVMAGSPLLSWRPTATWFWLEIIDDPKGRRCRP